MKKLMKSKWLSAILSIVMVLTLVNGLPVLADGVEFAGFKFASFGEGAKTEGIADAERVLARNEEGGVREPRILAATAQDKFSFEASGNGTVQSNATIAYNFNADVKSPVAPGQPFFIRFTFKYKPWSKSGTQYLLDGLANFLTEIKEADFEEADSHGNLERYKVVTGVYRTTSDKNISNTYVTMVNYGGGKGETFNVKAWMKKEISPRNLSEVNPIQEMEGIQADSTVTIQQKAGGTKYTLRYFNPLDPVRFKGRGYFNRKTKAVYLSKEEKEAASDTEAEFGTFYNFPTSVTLYNLNNYSLFPGDIGLRNGEEQSYRLNYGLTYDGSSVDEKFQPIHIASALLRDDKNLTSAQNKELFKKLGVVQIYENAKSIASNEEANFTVYDSGSPRLYINEGFEATEGVTSEEEATSEVPKGTKYIKISVREGRLPNHKFAKTEDRRKYAIGAISVFFVPYQENLSEGKAAEFKTHLNRLQLKGETVSGQEALIFDDSDDDSKSDNTLKLKVTNPKALNVADLTIKQYLDSYTNQFRPDTRSYAVGSPQIYTGAHLYISDVENVRKLHLKQLVKFEAGFFHDVIASNGQKTVDVEEIKAVLSKEYTGGSAKYYFAVKGNTKPSWKTESGEDRWTENTDWKNREEMLKARAEDLTYYAPDSKGLPPSGKTVVGILFEYSDGKISTNTLKSYTNMQNNGTEGLTVFALNSELWLEGESASQAPESYYTADGAKGQKLKNAPNWSSYTTENDYYNPLENGKTWGDYDLLQWGKTGAESALSKTLSLWFAKYNLYVSSGNALNVGDRIQGSENYSVNIRNTRVLALQQKLTIEKPKDASSDFDPVKINIYTRARTVKGNKYYISKDNHILRERKMWVIPLDKARYITFDAKSNEYISNNPTEFTMPSPLKEVLDLQQEGNGNIERSFEFEASKAGQYYIYTTADIGREDDVKNDIVNKNVYLVTMFQIERSKSQILSTKNRSYPHPLNQLITGTWSFDISRSGSVGVTAYSAPQVAAPSEEIEFVYNGENPGDDIPKFAAFTVLPFNGEEKTGRPTSENVPAYEVVGNKIELTSLFGKNPPALDILYTTDESIRKIGSTVPTAKNLDFSDFMDDGTKTSFTIYGKTWKKSQVAVTEDKSIRTYTFNDEKPTAILLKGKYTGKSNFQMKYKIKQTEPSTTGLTKYVSDLSVLYGKDISNSETEFKETTALETKVISKIVKGKVTATEGGADGINGAKVKLMNGSSVATDAYNREFPAVSVGADGSYEFKDVADSGQKFSVQVELPSGNDGKFVKFVGPGSASDIAMPSYEVLKTQKKTKLEEERNFIPFYINKSVSGFVYKDIDGNGVRNESTENTGVSDVTVKIYHGDGTEITQNIKGEALQSNYNPSTGSFRFEYLPDSNTNSTDGSKSKYLVKVEKANGGKEEFFLTSRDGQIVVSKEASVELDKISDLKKSNTGENTASIDFGLKTVVKKIKGRVTLNSDGLNGATLKLVKRDGSTLIEKLNGGNFGDGTDGVVTTKANTDGAPGYYEFNLPADSTDEYKVLLTYNTGSNGVFYQLGTLDDVSTSDKLAPLGALDTYATIAADTTRTALEKVVNFKLKRTEKRIYVHVFHDLDGDGIKDHNEEGLDNVSIVVKNNNQDVSEANTEGYKATIDAYNKTNAYAVFKELPEATVGGKANTDYEIMVTVTGRQASDYFRVKETKSDGLVPDTFETKEGTLSDSYTYTVKGMKTAAQLKGGEEARHVYFALKKITKKITGTVKKDNQGLGNETVKISIINKDMNLETKSTTVTTSNEDATKGQFSFVPEDLTDKQYYRVTLVRDAEEGLVILNELTDSTGKKTSKGEEVRIENLRNYATILADNSTEDIVTLNYNLKKATKTLKVYVFNDNNFDGQLNGKDKAIEAESVSFMYQGTTYSNPTREGNAYIFKGLPENKGNNTYKILIRKTVNKNQFFQTQAINVLSNESPVKSELNKKATSSQDNQFEMDVYLRNYDEISEFTDNPSQEVTVNFGLVTLKKKISGRVTDGKNGLVQKISLFLNDNMEKETSGVEKNAYSVMTKKDDTNPENTGKFEFLVPADATSYKIVLDDNRPNKKWEKVFASLNDKIVTDPTNPRTVANIQLSDYETILTNPIDESTKKEAVVNFVVKEAKKEVKGIVYADNDGNLEFNTGDTKLDSSKVKVELLVKTGSDTETLEAGVSDNTTFTAEEGYSFKALSDADEYTLKVTNKDNAEHQYIILDSRLTSNKQVTTDAKTRQETFTLDTYEDLFAANKTAEKTFHIGIKTVEKIVTGTITGADVNGQNMDLDGTTVAISGGNYTFKNPAQKKQNVLAYKGTLTSEQKMSANIDSADVAGTKHSIVLPSYNEIAKNPTKRVHTETVNFTITDNKIEVGGFIKDANGNGYPGATISLTHDGKTYTTGEHGNTYNEQNGEVHFEGVGKKDGNNDYTVGITYPNKKANEFFVVVDGEKEQKIKSDSNTVTFPITYDGTGNFAIPNVTVRTVEKKIKVKVMNSKSEILKNQDVVLKGGTTDKELNTGDDGVIEVNAPEDLPDGKNFTVELKTQHIGEDVSSTVTGETGSEKGYVSKDITFPTYLDIFKSTNESRVKEVTFYVGLNVEAYKKISGHITGLTGEKKVKVSYKPADGVAETTVYTTTNNGYYEFLTNSTGSSQLGDAFDKNYTVKLEQALTPNQFAIVKVDGKKVEEEVKAANASASLPATIETKDALQMNTLDAIKKDTDNKNKFEAKTVDFEVVTYNKSLSVKVVGERNNAEVKVYGVSGSNETLITKGVNEGATDYATTVPDTGILTFNYLPDYASYKVVLERTKAAEETITVEKASANTKTEAQSIVISDLASYAAHHADKTAKMTEGVTFNITKAGEKTISGTFFLDKNGNGTYDDGESIDGASLAYVNGTETTPITVKKGVFTLSNLTDKNGADYKIKVTYPKQPNEFLEFKENGRKVGYVTESEDNTVSYTLHTTPVKDVGKKGENTGLDITVKTVTKKLVVKIQDTEGNPVKVDGNLVNFTVQITGAGSFTPINQDNVTKQIEFVNLDDVDGDSYNVTLGNLPEGRVASYSITGSTSGKGSTANVNLSKFKSILDSGNLEMVKEVVFTLSVPTKATKNIAGYVTDSKGKRVAGAKVVLTYNGSEISVTTPDTGYYSFDNLDDLTSGSYALHLEKALKANERFGEVTVDGTVETNVTKEAGKVTLTNGVILPTKEDILKDTANANKIVTRNVNFKLETVKKSVSLFVPDGAKVRLTDANGRDLSDINGNPYYNGTEGLAGTNGQVVFDNLPDETEVKVILVKDTAVGEKISVQVGNGPVQFTNEATLSLKPYRDLLTSKTDEPKNVIFTLHGAGAKSISGKIYLDKNRNGVFDGEDTAITGASLAYSNGNVADQAVAINGTQFSLTGLKDDNNDANYAFTITYDKKDHQFFKVKVDGADVTETNGKYVVKTTSSEKLATQNGNPEAKTLDIALWEVERKIKVKVVDEKDVAVTGATVQLGTEEATVDSDGIHTFTVAPNMTDIKVTYTNAPANRKVDYTLGNRTGQFEAKAVNTVDAITFSSFEEIFKNTSGTETLELVFKHGVPVFATRKISGFVEGLKENETVKVQLTAEGTTEALPEAISITKEGAYEFTNLPEATSYTVSILDATGAPKALQVNEFAKITVAGGAVTEKKTGEELKTSFTLQNDETILADAANTNKLDEKRVSFDFASFTKSIEVTVGEGLSGTVELWDVTNNQKYVTEVDAKTAYGNDGTVTPENKKVVFNNLPEAGSYKVRFTSEAELGVNEFVTRRVGTEETSKIKNVDTDSKTFEASVTSLDSYETAYNNSKTNAKTSNKETVVFGLMRHYIYVNVGVYENNDAGNTIDHFDFLMKEAKVELLDGTATDPANEVLDKKEANEAGTDGFFRFTDVSYKASYKVRVTLTSQNNEYYGFVLPTNADDVNKQAVETITMDDLFDEKETKVTKEAKFLIKNTKPWEVPEKTVSGKVWVEKGDNSEYNSTDAAFEGAIVKLVDQSGNALTEYKSLKGFDTNPVTLTGGEVTYLFKNPADAEKYNVVLDLNGNEYRYKVTEIVDGSESTKSFTLPTYRELETSKTKATKVKSFKLEELKRVIKGKVGIDGNPVENAVVRLKYVGGGYVPEQNGQGQIEVRTNEQGEFEIPVLYNTDATDFVVEVDPGTAHPNYKTLEIPVEKLANYEMLKSGNLQGMSAEVSLPETSFTKLERSVTGKIYIDKNSNNEYDVADDELVTGEDVKVTLKFADGTEVANFTTKDGTFTFSDFADKDTTSDSTTYMFDFANSGKISGYSLTLVEKDGITAYSSNQFSLDSYKKMKEINKDDLTLNVNALFKYIPPYIWIDPNPGNGGGGNQGGSGTGQGSDNQNGNGQGGDNQNGNGQGGDNQNGNGQGGDNQNGNGQGGDNQNGNGQGGDNQNGNGQGGDNQNGNGQDGDNQNGTDNTGEDGVIDGDDINPDDGGDVGVEDIDISGEDNNNNGIIDELEIGDDETARGDTNLDDNEFGENELDIDGDATPQGSTSIRDRETGKNNGKNDGKGGFGKAIVKDILAVTGGLQSHVVLAGIALFTLILAFVAIELIRRRNGSKRK